MSGIQTQNFSGDREIENKKRFKNQYMRPICRKITYKDKNLRKNQSSVLLFLFPWKPYDEVG
jgi:hypothetical protein